MPNSLIKLNSLISRSLVHSPKLDGNRHGGDDADDHRRVHAGLVRVPPLADRRQGGVMATKTMHKTLLGLETRYWEALKERKIV